MNTVNMIGRLTKDPELKYTTSGTGLCNFSIALETGQKDAPHTSFFECIAWKTTGENINKYFRKGQRIGIEGSLKQNRWENEGKKFSKILITVFKFDFIENKSQESKPEAPEAPEAPENVPGDVNPFSDDIPF